MVALLAKRNGELQKLKKIFVVCPTEKINGFYSEIVDDKSIMDCYDEKCVEKLITKMTEINSNNQIRRAKINY